MGIFDGIVNVFKPITQPLAQASGAIVGTVTGMLGVAPAHQVQQRFTEQAPAYITAGILAAGAIGAGVIAAPAIAGSSLLEGGGALGALGGLASQVDLSSPDVGVTDDNSGFDLPDVSTPFDDGSDTLSNDLADFT